LKYFYKKNFFKAVYLILLGAFSAFSLPPYNFFIINFLTFTLFFYFIFNKKSEKKNNFSFFKYGWYFGFGYFLFSLYWISIALTFDEDFTFLIPISLILVPSFLAIFYGLVTYLFSILYSKKTIVSFLIFSLIFGLIEFIRGIIFTGFPWNLIAFSFLDSKNFIQILSITGTYSFNLICISIFTSPALIILRKSKKEVIVFSFFTVISIIFLIFGNIKNNKFDLKKINKHEYTVRSISSNIKLERFYKVQDESKIIEELIFLSKPQNNKKIIFIWPEGIITETYLDDVKIYKDLFSNSFSNNHLILLGVNSSKTINENKLYYNSLGVFDNNLNLLGSYNKNKLVPFGEFIPFEKVLSKIGLKTITNNFQSFSKGEERKSINIKFSEFNFSFLPLICYEIIYSGQISGKQKFDYILNISEDGWFGNSIGPEQHFAHSIFRSIESGNYIIRSANNGISAIINPLGGIVGKIESEKTGYIDFTESKSVEKTLFSMFGNKIFIFITLLYIILIFSFNKIKNE